MAFDLKATFVAVGRVLGGAWRAVATRLTHGRRGLRRGIEAANELRRSYIFGGISRQEFDESVQKTGTGRRPRRRRKTPA